MMVNQVGGATQLDEGLGSVESKPAETSGDPIAPSLVDKVFLAELDRLIADGLVYVEVDDEIPRFGVTAKGLMFSHGLSFKAKRGHEEG